MPSMMDTQDGMLGAKAALHGVSPYQGKLSPARAKELVELLSRKGDLVVDPFCGCGTVLLEAWSLGRRGFGLDLNPYAIAVAKAKLSPLMTVSKAEVRMLRHGVTVARDRTHVDLRRVPKWVRSFYHPETLRDALAWSATLRSKRENFLFGCFLNLLHHQRPGFLSFPAAHVTPHLRPSLFPKDKFPHLYEYRDVASRLQKKVARTLKHGVPFDDQLQREAVLGDAASRRLLAMDIDCIVTSPPYMAELDYARDNRLRLWFCGHDDWRALDSRISPSRSAFVSVMERCLEVWESRLRCGGHIALVLGDSRRSGPSRVDVPLVVQRLVDTRFKSLELIDLSVSEIPSTSRVVRNRLGTVAEATLIYRKRFI
jgi:SAM-dependent methyltransferase